MKKRIPQQTASKPQNPGSGGWRVGDRKPAPGCGGGAKAQKQPSMASLAATAITEDAAMEEYEEHFGALECVFEEKAL